MPPPDDHRFQGDAWQQRPYSLLAQALLLDEEWWDSVLRGQEGVSETNQRIVAFTVRQLLDMLSPSNVPWLNPEVIEAIQNTGGRNLIAGLENFLRDSAGAAPTGFKVGENLAVTPGKVVFRNELIELIQYAPATAKVATEPVLIISAWIMKYYILDLSPGNSTIRWLVGEGHTVFAISWRNPRADMSETWLDLTRYVFDQIETNAAAIMLRAIERHWARDEREPKVAPPDRTLRHGLSLPDA